jgi:recombinational DNA repair protein RecR
VISFKYRLCVLDIKSIRELILKEAHETAYSIHPRSEKMYQDMKKEVLVVQNEKRDCRACCHL